MRQFAMFCVAGGLAFLVDAGVLHVLVSSAYADPYSARLVSFLCAVTTTWWFNRRFTFFDATDSSPVRQWLRYVVSQLGGFSVNYAVYAALVLLVPLVSRWPVLGVAAGSIAGLLVNFVLARRYVFERENGAGSAGPE